MIRLTVKRLLAGKRRAVGSGLAVVIGVAFLAATLVLGDTMRASFDRLYAEANAGTDVVVRNRTEIGGGDADPVRGPTDQALVARLAALPHVAAVAPQVTGIAQITAADGTAIGGGGPPTVGTNWIADARLNPWRIAEGRAPRREGEVVVDAASAAEGGLRVGSRTTVRTPEPRPVTVVGIARLGDRESFSGATFASFDLTTAQRWFARPGQVSAVLVHADDATSPEVLRREVAGAVDGRSEVLTGAQLTEEQRDALDGDFLGFLQGALVAFAGVALLVSAFSIHNTFSILVAQRSRESALLRALGASRRQVLVGAAAEALTVGVVASAVGVGAGIGLALGLKAVLGGTGLELVVPGVVVSGGAVLAALALGVVVTLVSTVVPAVRSSRAAPLAALRDVAVEAAVPGRVRAGLGLAVLGGGVAAVVAAGRDGSLPLLGLGGLACLAGAVVLGPVVARPVGHALGWPLARLTGTSGRLAQRNVGRNPRRTAGSATALLVGVAVVTLFTTMAASVKSSMAQIIERSFGGDLVVSADFGTPGIAPEVAARSAELPEVGRVVAITDGQARIDGRDEQFPATDLAALEGLIDLDVRQGSLARLRPDQVAVSEDYARDHHLRLGSDLAVGYADGSRQRMEVGVLYAENDLMGDLVFPASTWAPHAATTADSVLLYDLAPGVSLAEGQRAVQAVADRYAAPHVQTSDEFLDQAAGEVDQVLVVVYGLLGLAILIALMGIANTLSLSVHERTRELGLLRAVGQSRRQLRATIRGESVVTAVLGTLGGLLLGGFLGWGVMEVLGTAEGFGRFSLPVRQLVVIVVLAGLAGVVAAVRPARRAARLDVLAAVAAS